MGLRIEPEFLPGIGLPLGISLGLPLGLPLGLVLGVGREVDTPTAWATVAWALGRRNFS